MKEIKLLLAWMKEGIPVLAFWIVWAAVILPVSFFCGAINENTVGCALLPGAVFVLALFCYLVALVNGWLGYLFSRIAKRWIK